MGELRWWAFQHASVAWRGWERIYLRFRPTTPAREGSLFAVRRNGDSLELHLDGRALNRMRAQPRYSAFKALHEMRADLEALAARIRSGEFSGVRDIRAKTVLGEAAGSLGFHTRPAPRNLSNWLEQYYQVGLDAIYHPRGLRENSKRRWPVEIRMTTEALLARYPEKSDRSTVAR